jgi:trigger factor
MGAVKTQTKELADSRVRVEVEVGSEAIERELTGAAGDIGRDLKVPGFRKGKVPPQVVLQQVGRQAVLDEAVRRALPLWYDEAVQEAGLAPVGRPSLDLEALPERGAPLAFSFEVGVRPQAELGDYERLEVPRRDPEVADEEIDAELELVRESLASLETVNRPAASGDYVVIDFDGSIAERRPDGGEAADQPGEVFEGGEARGFLLELGSGRLIEGFEDKLEGAQAGEERTVEVPFPDDYEAEHLAGKLASFAVSVKEVKEKRLPELDDDFAVLAGGFESIDEAREDVARRLREKQEEEIEREFRQAAVDAVAAEAKLDLPDELVHAKAHEMWHATARQLAGQGIDPERYLEIVGKTEEELVAESSPEAERALRREAALAAVIEAEGIEVTDEELFETLRDTAGKGADKPPSEKALRRSLEKAKKRGADDALREDIAMRKAVDLLVERAQPIAPERAKARDELWTPEKQAKKSSGKLWTPGS